MRIRWAKAALAGIAGTIAFDVVGLLLTQQWDIPQLLGMKMGLGLAAGVSMHYAVGVLIAWIYAGIGPSLWGPDWARALLFITAETIFGVGLFMMPLLDMGLFGLEGGMAMPLIGMLRHWAYGIVLAVLYPIAAISIASSKPVGV